MGTGFRRARGRNPVITLHEGEIFPGESGRVLPGVPVPALGGPPCFRGRVGPPSISSFSSLVDGRSFVSERLGFSDRPVSAPDRVDVGHATNYRRSAAFLDFLPPGTGGRHDPCLVACRDSRRSVRLDSRCLDRAFAVDRPARSGESFSVYPVDLLCLHRDDDAPDGLRRADPALRHVGRGDDPETVGRYRKIASMSCTAPRHGAFLDEEFAVR